MAERYVTRQALVDPGSPSAESFRTLRLALQLRAKSDLRSAVLVTSAEPGAGKSTIASNFAMVSALAHTSVVLIDADLRRPVQHEIFGLTRSPGLIELLASGGAIGAFVQPVSNGLDVLTAGRAVGRASDVSASPRMVEVLTEAAAQYDLVIIDTAPVLPTADAESISSQFDVEVVFVTSPASHRRSVVKALRRLELIDAKIAGIVMNRDGQQDAYGY
jgi:capsular exopolysaccharide synthesis family protein